MRWPNRRLLILMIWLVAGASTTVILTNEFGSSDKEKSQRSLTPPTNRYGHFIVVRDADGDTIQVKDASGVTFYVRFLEIDTPETHRPGTVVQCGGPEASAYTHAQIPNGSTVLLKPDPYLDQVDRYGRTLAYVYVRSHPINLRLVRLGYAHAYHYLGQRGIFATTIDRYEREAKAAKRGIWGPPCNGDTKQPEP